MTESEKEMQQHERFMSRCIELAEKGAGNVSPNPMVGSVLVAGSRVIGEGCHERFGGAHAEVNAIASVSDQSMLKQATLYVNLEPCSHFGKTPPCADLIIEKDIPRVVVACRDPHEKVAGKGIQRLRDAGIDVLENVLHDKALKLNEAFVKSHEKSMPFVAVKLAETLDGKVATGKGLSKWITGNEARQEVHRQRSRYDAVLSAASTVLADDPLLTVRHVEGRNPLRVVLDRNLRVPLTAKVFNREAKTLLFTANGRAGDSRIELLREREIEVCCVNEDESGLDLKEVMCVLHAKSILSVYVESGPRLAASLIQCGLVDKIFLYIAPLLFGGDGLDAVAPLGVEAPDNAPRLQYEKPCFFGEDLLVEAYLHHT